MYIILAFALAGLNFGYAGQASDHIAELINKIWHFYENWIKTILIFLGGFLALRFRSKRGRTYLYRKNLIGFIIAALVIHIFGPYFFSNPNLYYFAMPLPWTNQPLQLMVPGTNFYLSFTALQGKAAVGPTLLFYLFVTAVVFIGTVIYGRRWQCSTLCLFSGFVSEVFAPAFPLIGKPKKAGTAFLRLFKVLRWLFLTVALFFTAAWLLLITGFPLNGNLDLLSQLEIYKYLLFDLIAAMLLWTFITGRAYCYYCPLGTVMGLIGRAAGQRILTNLQECISCGKCNRACPMAINIMNFAAQGKEVDDLNCVGCGHCIDACPTATLAYTTKLIRP